MAIDLVSAIGRYLTPEVVGKIASASGLSGTVAQSAVTAAVPAILSTLVKVVTTSGGPKKLADAVASQPGSVLTDITSKLNGSAQLATQGSSLLSSLMGGGVANLLASTVGKFLGIGEGPVKTVMGLLTPVVLGMLGNQQRATNLDSNGLARLLSGQKDQIAEAMPSGLSDALKKSGLLPSVSTGPSPERRTVHTPTTPAMRRTADSTRAATWPYWVLPLLAMAGLLWYLFPGAQRTEPIKTSERTVQSPERASIYLARLPDGWVSIGSTPNEYVTRNLYNRAGENLGTIKDIVVDADGKMAAALVNVGQYLGIGDKAVAIPFTALQHEPSGNTRRIVVDATKEQLQAAPTVAPHPALKR